MYVCVVLYMPICTHLQKHMCMYIVCNLMQCHIAQCIFIIFQYYVIL